MICKNIAFLAGGQIDKSILYNYENIAPEGRAYDGLVDAANTAVLSTKLETDPDYRLNEYYETARKEDVDHLSFSMGDLFAGIVLA